MTRLAAATGGRIVTEPDGAGATTPQAAWPTALTDTPDTDGVTAIRGEGEETAAV